MYIQGHMAKQKRSDDWGFPRWRAYGKGRDAAKVRLCDREVGSIAAGKRADLILIDGDPVRDPAALGRIQTVFKAGIGYDRQALLDSARGLIGYR